MPHRMWKHACACEQWSASGQEICPRCGQPGAFDSWTHGVVEFMGRHERRTGYPFMPWPKHCRLPQLKRECPLCGGLGVLDIDQGRDWRTCDHCNGDGGLPNFPPEVMRGCQQAFRRLLDLSVAARTGRSGGCVQR